MQGSAGKPPGHGEAAHSGGANRNSQEVTVCTERLESGCLQSVTSVGAPQGERRSCSSSPKGLRPQANSKGTPRASYAKAEAGENHCTKYKRQRNMILDSVMWLMGSPISGRTRHDHEVSQQSVLTK